MKQRIAALYSCDINYHELTLYSLASVARAHQSSLDFHIMQVDYRRAVPSNFHEFMTARGHRLFTTTATATPVKSEQRVGTSWEHLTDAMFHKAAAIQSLVSDYDYIIYLDSDLLAFRELRFDALIGFDELCAACFDIPVASGIEHPDFFLNCEQSHVSPQFFNVGLIVVNAAQWVATRAHERFINALTQHAAGCPYFRRCVLNDQCVFNMVVNGNFRPLPLKFNMQQGALHTKAWETATIRHYNGRDKFLKWRPWTCDPLQHKLLQSICRDAGLPRPSGIYDFGVSYRLNGIRRRRTIARFEQAIETLHGKTTSGITVA
jgi:lipopolysaccharide biosynthesis glycosyltransferase